MINFKRHTVCLLITQAKGVKGLASHGWKQHLTTNQDALLQVLGASFPFSAGFQDSFTLPIDGLDNLTELWKILAPVTMRLLCTWSAHHTHRECAHGCVVGVVVREDPAPEGHQVEDLFWKVREKIARCFLCTSDEM